MFQNVTESQSVFDFIISPGATRSFELIIIDDNIAEFHRKEIDYDLYVHGFNGIDYIDRKTIYIKDNDGKYS